VGGVRQRLERLEAAQKRERAGSFPWELEDLRAMEAEVEERQRAYAEESRRRDREFLKRNRALVGLPPLESEE
jgi:hypothetical protein